VKRKSAISYRNNGEKAAEADNSMVNKARNVQVSDTTKAEKNLKSRY
jgi:hypothetical protein